jgi:hypothetical protein
MSRLLITLTAGSFALLSFGTPSAWAASPQATCEDAGGVYTNTSGDKQCVFPEENVGNAPEHSNSQTTQTTDTGHGHIKFDPAPTCEGPRGQCK